MGPAFFMRYKLVIFDFDGTLADSFGWFLDTFDEIADRFDFKRLDRGNIDALRQMNARELMQLHGVPLWKVPMIAAFARKQQSQDLHKIKPFDGISETIEELSGRGVKLAVVTSNARANVERVLGSDITSHVDHFSCGSSLFGKAARFRAVARAFDVQPGDVLAIGDEVRDIAAAREAGFASGAVAWGYSAPERLAQDNPDHLFATPEDIAVLFRTLAAKIPPALVMTA